MPGSPSLPLSLAVLGAALLIAAFANYQLRRDYIDRIKGVPWFAVQFVAAAISFVMMAHVISLLTGQPFHSSRAGY